MFIAANSAWYTTHFVFTHVDGPFYDVMPVYVPAGPPIQEPLAFSTWTGRRFKAFLASDGLAVYGNFWRQGAMVEERHFNINDPKGSCEVWYERSSDHSRLL